MGHQTSLSEHLLSNKVVGDIFLKKNGIKKVVWCSIRPLLQHNYSRKSCKLVKYMVIKYDLAIICSGYWGEL